MRPIFIVMAASAILALIFVGATLRCDAAASPSALVSREGWRRSTEVSVIDDRETGSRCYVTSDGISCVARSGDGGTR